MWNNRHFAFYALLDPLSVSHTPKMVPPYSLDICPPKTPKTLWSPVTPSSRKNRFSKGISFWQITQTVLESPKIDICQNWPRRVLEDVIRCLEYKFDKKSPVGSVPNCWKEITMCHVIRWFKCKFKPPKKSNKQTMEEVHKKINSHNKVHTYWCQFLCQIWRSPKLFKNTFYAHFEGF